MRAPLWLMALPLVTGHTMIVCVATSTKYKAQGISALMLGTYDHKGSTTAGGTLKMWLSNETISQSRDYSLKESELFHGRPQPGFVRGARQTSQLDGCRARVC